MHRILCWLLLAGSIGSTVLSCRQTSRMYSTTAERFHVQGGEVVWVDNLTGAVHERLRDGAAIGVGGVGCRVLLRQGKLLRTFDVPPGSQIVLGKKGDYVLNGDELRPRPSTDGSFRGDEEEALISAVDEVLSQIDAGAVVEARERMESLTTRFPGSSAARMMRALLARRIPQPQPERADAAGIVTEGSVEEFLQRGLERLAENDRAAALKEFEEAFRRDPAHPEVAERLVALLKDTGLQLYSGGEVNEAMKLWERVLEIRPDDAETLRFIYRAQTVEKQL